MANSTADRVRSAGARRMRCEHGRTKPWRECRVGWSGWISHRLLLVVTVVLEEVRRLEGFLGWEGELDVVVGKEMGDEIGTNDDDNDDDDDEKRGSRGGREMARHQRVCRRLASSTPTSSSEANYP